MKGVDGFWISHLLAVSLWQDGLKVIPREECTSQSISKNTAFYFFQEWILIFDHFKLTCHEAPAVHTHKWEVLHPWEKKGLLNSILDWRSETSNSSAKLRNRWQHHRRSAEAEKPFGSSSQSRSKPGSLKIKQNYAHFSATKQLFIQWKDNR